MPKEIKTSHPLWDYFSKVTAEPKKAMCNLCCKKLSHKTTITNLKSHLKRQHNAHYNAYIKNLNKHNTLVQDTNKPTVSTNPTVYLFPISSTYEHQIKYEVAAPGNEDSENSDEEEMRAIDNKIRGILSPEEKKQIDARLLMFIIKSYQAVTIVEEQAFLDLVRALNADYTMLERKDITKKILPEMYSKCLEEQKAIVKQGAATICLTVDRWTSIIYEDSLIAITGHFITPDFKFKSVLLKCHYCEGISEDLVTVLTETCAEWDIAGKINWCVTDDGADIVQAVNSLGWNHKGCMAYKLNLTLQNSLKLCDETLSKVEKVVSFFDTNYESEQMDVYQTRHGTAEPLELLDSEPTSWTSKYDMIERFVTLQEAVEAIITELDDEAELPDITAEDWNKLKQLCKLMKPFKEATKELGADKYASASKVIAVVNGLRDVLQELRKRPDCYYSVQEVVECIAKELNEKFNEIESEPNLALCTILDPRYKMSMFLDESAAEMAKLSLVSEIEGLMKNSANPSDSLKVDGGPSTANNEDGADLSLWRRRTMILEKRLVNQGVNHHKLAQQEVESYMQEELADEDPCDWWQSNESKFPHLTKLFKTKCNKVATSVPSENLFTKQGIDLCERRNRLSLRKAEMIVFLNANLNDDDYCRLMPET